MSNKLIERWNRLAGLLTEDDSPRPTRTHSGSAAHVVQSGDTRRIGGAPAQYIAVSFLQNITGATVASNSTSSTTPDVTVRMDGNPVPYKVECKAGQATFDVPRTASSVGDWLWGGEDALLHCTADLSSYKLIVWNEGLKDALVTAGVDHHYIEPTGPDSRKNDFISWINSNCTVITSGRTSTVTVEHLVPQSLATSSQFANNMAGATVTAPTEGAIVSAIHQTIQAEIFHSAQVSRAQGVVDILSNLGKLPSGCSFDNFRKTQESMIGRHSCFPLCLIRNKQMSSPLLHKVFDVSTAFSTSLPRGATAVTSSEGSPDWEDGNHWAESTIGGTTVYAKISAFKSGTARSNRPPRKPMRRALGGIEILAYIHDNWSDIWAIYNQAQADGTLTVLTSTTITPPTNPTAEPPQPANSATEGSGNETDDDILEKMGAAVRTLKDKREGTSDPKATTLVQALLVVATGDASLSSLGGYRISVGGESPMPLTHLRYKRNASTLTAVLMMTSNWKLYSGSDEISGAYNKYQTAMNPTTEVREELESSDLPANISKADLKDLLLSKFGGSIEAYNTKATEIFEANTDKFTKSKAPTLASSGNPRPQCTKAAMKTLYVLLPADTGSSESGTVWEPYASEEEAEAQMTAYDAASNSQKSTLSRRWRSKGMDKKGGTNSRRWDAADLWASPSAQVGDNFRKEGKKLSFKELMFEMYSLNEIANMDLERAKDNLAAFILGDDEEVEETIDNE